MQPAARLAAAIELLSEIEAEMAARRAPADVLVSNFFRARRYAGSKDRRAVSGIIYAIIRGRALYAWALDGTGLPLTARTLVIAYLCHNDQHGLDMFGEAGKFAPEALDEAEVVAAAQLKALDWGSAPQAVAAAVPAWAEAGLQSRFGVHFQAAAKALLESAPLDIRLNRLKTGDETLDKVLKKESEVFEKNKFSLLGYRASEAINLMAHPAFKQGLVEIQDEAAQVASSLVGAQAGHQVVDLCAGAGGKSLALAADMQNRGQIHAFDVSGKRLAELSKRAQRAGARNIQVSKLPLDGGDRQTKLTVVAERADRVVLDVPCSGTGTWRRSPDQRWRFDAEQLQALNLVQDNLLMEGASLVKPGGRLVYMTCSLLPQENEDRVDTFLAAQQGDTWRTVDYRELWPESAPTSPPDSLSSHSWCLQLAPHSHGTDGFFIAVLERAI